MRSRAYDDKPSRNNFVMDTRKMADLRIDKETALFEQATDRERIFSDYKLYTGRG